MDQKRGQRRTFEELPEGTIELGARCRGFCPRLGGRQEGEQNKEGSVLKEQKPRF